LKNLREGIDHENKSYGNSRKPPEAP